MRLCFLCDTPFQILSCLNLVYDNEKIKNDKKDIYIGVQFANADQIVTKLTKLGMFDRVYSYNYIKAKKNRGKYILVKASEVFFPSRSVELFIYGKNVLPSSYDKIYMSVYNNFTTDMKLRYPKAEVIMFDDGIGSYTGKILKESFKKRKLLYRLTRRKFPNMYPKKLYLNIPEAFIGMANIDTRRLTRLSERDEKFRKIINQLFDNQGIDKYENRRLIYLTQPPLMQLNDADDERAEIQRKNVKNLIQKYNDSCLCRVHPMQKREEFSEYEIDDSNALWEMICADHISNNHILLGMYSTAQFMPKFLYNKEPYLIFIYQIFVDKKNPELNEWKKMIDKVRSLYTNKDKVIEIQDVNHLKNTLDQLISV